MLWTPEPPRDGDPVYCCGVVIGTVGGAGGEGASYILTKPVAELPPRLAAYIRSRSEAG